MKTESFTTSGALSTTRSWTYDARYRVTEERFDVVDSSGGVAKMAVGYGFGDGGQVTSVAYPAGTGGYTTGEVVTYEHDPVTGALTGAVSDTTSFKVDSVGYDYAGRMLSTLYGDTNGTREERAYEQSTGRLRYVYGGGAPSNSYYQHQRFFYDPGGNVTAVFDLRNPVAWASRQTLCYEYDDLDRLTRAYTQQTGSWPTNGPDCTGTPSMTAAGDTAEPGTGYDRTYTYDQAGNITTVNETYDDPTTTGDDRFTLTYTYPVAGQARPHAVTSVTDTSGPNWSFGYDQAGNMTTRVVDPASQALTYDPQNRLATVTDTGDVTTFGYDLDGNRLRTTTTAGGDRLYAGSWWETTTSSGQEVTYYRFNNAMVAYADTTGAVDYLFTDHLGSVTTTHGASGTLNNRYHPYGEPRDTLQVTATEYGYTGQRADQSTGLMYYQARYYDPTLRRFTQPDTIIPNPLNPQDLNRYTYTANNPVRYTDPSGHVRTEGDLSDLYYSELWNARVNLALGQQLYNSVNSKRVKSHGDGALMYDLALHNQRWQGEINRLTGQTGGNGLHGFLDVLGLIPGVGEVFDFINALYYYAEGNNVDAAISLAGTVPFGGQAATVCRRFCEGLGALIRPASRACSFSGETEVVMADGSTKPIAEVEQGDWVYAHDPEDGNAGARQVTAVWIHQDTLVDLLVNGGVVSTTEDHPFWNHTDGEWQRADNLDPGDLLLTADGGLAAVDGINWTTTRTDTAYNLTIQDIHTYFVDVGGSGDEVLVHNSDLCDLSGYYEHLTYRDLAAARLERAGKVVAIKPNGMPFDHVLEVQEAQRGLVNRIQAINRRLGYPGLEASERAALETSLAEASQLLDYSEGFLPR